MAVRKKFFDNGIRIQSFIIRAKKLLSEGNVKAAMDITAKGLNYYSNRILSVTSPYAEMDAGLLVLSLRHIADEIERENPGTKEFVDEFSKSLSFPEVPHTCKIIKPNCE